MSDFFEKAKLAIEKCLNKREMKLEIEFEHLLKNYFESIGLPEIEGQYEEHAGNVLVRSRKRKDATYGHVVIEYEHVGALSTPSAKNHAIEQLTNDYLPSYREEELPEVVGIAFDGLTVIFIRWVDGEWNIEEREFSEQSFGLMLNYLVGLFKTSFKELPFEFGFHREDTRKTLRILYEKSLNNNKRAAMLFDEWNLRFSSIYGNAFTKARIKEHFGDFGSRIGIKRLDPNRFIFVVHTYYAFVVKIVAAEVAASLFEESPKSHIKVILESGDLKSALSDVENGRFFRDIGVDNFVEGTFLSWYLDVWDNEIQEVLREIIHKLDWFDFAEFVTRPEAVVDYLKNFYQETFPKQLRHDLGEFYTPDWLARHVVDVSGYSGESQTRVLDPACGSGTFLVAILRKVRKKHKHLGFSKRLVDEITHNIVGFDINPVAVLTARTNYLIALSAFHFQRTNITLPIYLTDSVVLPKLDSQTTLADETELYRILTTKGTFAVPAAIRDRVSAVMMILKAGIENEQDAANISAQLRNQFSLDPSVLNHLLVLYAQMQRLNRDHQNRIWSDIIINQFAGLFLEPFDYVIGNPPWVNWEFLDQRYRANLISINDEYGLYFTKGLQSRLGTIRRDLSSIFFYVCSDVYLKEKGTIAFLLKPMYQIASGRGFRNFNRMQKDVRFVKMKTPLRVLQVEELTKENPFEINNEVSLLVAKKGYKTEYPIKYVRWTGKRNQEGQDYAAEPSEKSDPLSPWMVYTGRKPKKTLGTFAYSVREGVNFGQKEAFYDLNLLIDKGKTVQIRNASGKTKDVEKTLVYPLVMSRHIKRWHLADKNGEPYTFCILPQTRPGEKNEGELKRDCPKTWEWLQDFRKELLSRKSKSFEKDPFYSIYGLGDWNSKYKVVWKSMGFYPDFVVVSSVNDSKLGRKLVAVEHVQYFIPINHEDEAYYVCAVLNSSLVGKTLRQLSSKGKSGMGRIVRQIRVDRFDPRNQTHHRLSILSSKAHVLTGKNGDAEIGRIQDEIDELVELLYAEPEPSPGLDREGL